MREQEGATQAQSTPNRQRKAEEKESRGFGKGGGVLAMEVNSLDQVPCPLLPAYEALSKAGMSIHFPETTNSASESVCQPSPLG